MTPLIQDYQGVTNRRDRILFALKNLYTTVLWVQQYRCRENGVSAWFSSMLGFHRTIFNDNEFARRWRISVTSWTWDRCVTRSCRMSAPCYMPIVVLCSLFKAKEAAVACLLRKITIPRRTIRLIMQIQGKQETEAPSNVEQDTREADA